jgi:hypothetical protein
MSKNFTYHISTVLRTMKLAPDAHLTEEKRLRAAWSNAKHVLTCRTLNIRERIIILN